jgi:hypothetical protein
MPSSRLALLHHLHRYVLALAKLGICHVGLEIQI